MNFRYPTDKEFTMVAKLFYYEQTLFYGTDERHPLFLRHTNAFPMWMKEHACDAFVTDNGKAICCLTPNKDGSKYVYAIWVEKDFRNKGYGKALLEHAKTLSPKGLALHVSVQNPTALCLYSKVGFRVGTLESWIKGVWHRVYMETKPGLMGREKDTVEYEYPERE